MKVKVLFLMVLLTVFQVKNSMAQKDTTVNIQDKYKMLFGGSLSLGYGFMTSNVSEYIGNQLMLPLTAEMVYKNIALQLNMDGGWSKVKKDMVFADGQKWSSDDNAWHNYFSLNLSYAVVSNEKLLLAPYLGYASGYSKKIWWGESDISKHEPNAYYINVGVYFDLKRKLQQEGLNVGRYAGYDGLRLTIGAYIPTADIMPYPNYYNGAVVYVSIGATGLSLRKKK